jgi:hypothetical protein
MSNFEVVTPEERKQALMQLVDDMTGAAIDHSSQGYTQFLQYRNELIRVIDVYAQEDQRRIEFGQFIASKIDEYFPSK